MASTNTDDPNLHVVMLPWSAFGHLIPFYHLSTSLAKKGVRVSYISTPRNIERLPKIPPNLAPLLQYVAFPFPAVPDTALPLGAEATVDMEFDDVQHLKAAYDLLREPFKRFVLASSPDWIISDFAAYWAPDVARECRTKLMHFSVFMTTFLLFFQSPEFRSGEGRKRVNKTHESLTTQPAEILPSALSFRDNEAAFFHTHLNSKSSSGITDGERAGRLIEGCKAIAIRTCREFDGDYLDHYQTLTDKPVIPTGLLPPPLDHEQETTSRKWSSEFEWLDKQKHKSVIYVGFGSEYKLTKHELYEIAYGLELARVPFIWALRRPTWATDDSESLPPGFLTRTSGKGLVWLGWAPQLRILGHPSIGGSLFHSGWGSIIETLKHGHSLVLLPFIFDQGLNARLMVDKGLGVEVERRDDGSYTRDDIANALRRAMVGVEAERIRAQARKAAEIFGDEKLHQEHYVGGLVEFLRNGNIE